MVTIIDALYDFVILLKDQVISIIEGLFVLVQSLGYILTYASQGFVWMPTFISTIIPSAVILIIVLRIVGR